ncbi:hypothetical protein QJS04_geneDACA022768 [Acorus gramineus]|uniref:Cytochrome b561 and DOMON domain-containing protein n=1 Tax=Acorus gramineus TaxID=55184 RepID=A0AAV9AXJ4_ACOGR|nr:hypothetical protein QJS04_geneDACA022768 [Acorus gramineus]
MDGPEPQLLLLLLFGALSASIITVDAQSDGCEVDLGGFLHSPFNDSSSLTCRPVWNNFILRYSQDPENVLTIVLSTVYTSGWVGMGFSSDGMMVGSSAMVGWINNVGKAHIKQYSLRGQSSSEVVVNEGQLKFAARKPVVALHSASIYLAFQLQFEAPVTQQEIIFAFGTATPRNYHLTKHEDKTSVSFDFSAGVSSASSASSSYPYQLKRNHGALNIFGWGVLLPIGAIIARYFRQHDPLWFYLHTIIQFSGFIIGLAGVVTGIALYDKLHADVLSHRALGIFVLVLGILQVLAFFLKPDKDSKIRRYWNWYHHWAGRLVLFLAAVNISVGIHVGSAGSVWKVCYGIDLAILLITVILLETMLWLRCSKKTTDAPAFQMQPT